CPALAHCLAPRRRGFAGAGFDTGRGERQSRDSVGTMGNRKRDDRNRALPHPEDAEMKVFVTGLGHEFLREAWFLAERAKTLNTADPGFPDENPQDRDRSAFAGRGASVAAVLMAEAALEAFLSEYVASFGYRGVISEATVAEIGGERHNARQWKL